MAEYKRKAAGGVATDYKRILSYLYRYEKSERKECCGFIKAEQKSGNLKMTVQIDDNRLLSGMTLKLCFYEKQEESWQVWSLCSVTAEPDKKEWQLSFAAGSLSAGFQIRKQSGVFLFYQESLYYGSVWIGEEIPREVFTPQRWHELREKEAAPGVVKPENMPASLPEQAAAEEKTEHTEPPEPPEQAVDSLEDAEMRSNTENQMGEKKRESMASQNEAEKKDGSKISGETADRNGAEVEIEGLHMSHPSGAGSPSEEADVGEPEVSGQAAVGRPETKPPENSTDAKRAEKETSPEDDLTENSEIIEELVQERAEETAAQVKKDTEKEKPEVRGEELLQNGAENSEILLETKDIGEDRLEKMWENSAEARTPVNNIFNPAFHKGYKISVQQLSGMGEEADALSGNQFLLKGYRRYRHLLAGKVRYAGEDRYCIGVPGIYENREKYMAQIYQFPVFLSLTENRIKTGGFGYWLHLLEP